MRSSLFIAFAVLISFTLVTTVFAQAPADKSPATNGKSTTMEKASPEKAGKAKTQKSVKLSGEVVKNDGKEMTVRGPKGEENFDVSGVKNADKYKVGDKVNISYKEKDGKLVAASIRKPLIKGTTEKKETKQSAEKPAPKTEGK